MLVMDCLVGNFSLKTQAQSGIIIKLQLLDQEAPIILIVDISTQELIKKINQAHIQFNLPDLILNKKES